MIEQKKRGRPASKNKMKNLIKVYFDDETYLDLEQAAIEHGVSVSELLRSLFKTKKEAFRLQILHELGFDVRTNPPCIYYDDGVDDDLFDIDDIYDHNEIVVLTEEQRQELIDRHKLDQQILQMDSETLESKRIY